MAHYSVVQYVPDPIADERINIGVVVIDGDDVALRFLARWHRVKQFGAKDLRFLRDFVKGVELQHTNFGTPQNRWTLDTLQRLSGWTGSIQFTEPRASLKGSAALLEEVASQFLKDEVPAERVHVSRAEAITLSLRAVRVALKDRFGPHASEYLKTRFSLQGKLSPHHFDLVAGNGHPFFAAQALSRQLTEQRSLERDINAAGWALEDVQAKNAEFPIALVAVPPIEPVVDAAVQENVERAQAVATRLRIPLLQPAQAEHWARRQLAHLR